MRQVGDLTINLNPSHQLMGYTRTSNSSWMRAIFFFNISENSELLNSRDTLEIMSIAAEQTLSPLVEGERHDGRVQSDAAGDEDEPAAGLGSEQELKIERPKHVLRDADTHDARE